MSMWKWEKEIEIHEMAYAEFQDNLTWLEN